MIRSPLAISKDPPPRWDEEQIYIDGDRYFNELLTAFTSARHSIDVEMYIYADDRVGEQVTTALIAAHARGVRVRVLVDGIGTPLWPHRQGTRLVEAGIESKVFHPPPWSALYSRVPGVLTSARFLSRLNRRDHRKVVIVDGESAWLGSMNISENHLVSLRGASAWRDTSVKVRGKAVNYLTAAFERIWLWRMSKDSQRQRKLRRLLAESSASIVRLNATRRLRRFHRKVLLQRMKYARDRIWICTPYFVPTLSLLRAFRLAAKRKIDVRMLFPERSDVFFMPWIAAAFHSALLASGIRVYRYTPTILHAKTMIIDDWATIGSSNLNHRSLIYDLEVDAVVTWPENQRELAEQFLNDLNNATELVQGRRTLRSLLELLLGRLIFVFRRWL